MKPSSSFNNFPFRPPRSRNQVAILRTTQAQPTESWWVGIPDREIFAARAKAEQERMRKIRLSPKLVELLEKEGW